MCIVKTLLTYHFKRILWKGSTKRVINILFKKKFWIDFLCVESVLFFFDGNIKRIAT